MSVLNQSGEEQVECPLCMEPLEVDDLNFYPCTCGYQICRFCWHRIRTDENGLCPACRKAYSENPADFTPLSKEQVAQLKAEKRQRDQQRKAKQSESRKHLASVRVVQRNLVFVVGLPMRLADPEILKRHEYFGKFGKIHKVVINQSTAYAGSQGPSASAYVTYMKSDDALRAIQSVNNIPLDGRHIKSSLGTTKYCSHFMKNQPCPKPDCMYLHDFGDPEASFTKEQMHAGKHQEYEKKLHEALQSRTAQAKQSEQAERRPNDSTSSKSSNGGGGGGKEQSAASLGNHHSGTSSSGNINSNASVSSGSSTSQNGGNGTKEGWPQLNDRKEEKKECKNNNNTVDSKKVCNSSNTSNINNRNGKINKNVNNIGGKKDGKSSSLSPTQQSQQKEASSAAGPGETERDGGVGVSESGGDSHKSQQPLLDDNSSFFSHQNSYQKLVPEHAPHDEPETSFASQILNDSFPDINSAEDWEAAFGFSKHGNHLEELAQQKTYSKVDSYFFGNLNVPQAAEAVLIGGHDGYDFKKDSLLGKLNAAAAAAAATADSPRLNGTTPQANGMDQMSKFFNDFTKNSKELGAGGGNGYFPVTHNGMNGYSQHHGNAANLINTLTDKHVMLMQQKQLEEQLVMLNLKHQNQQQQQFLHSTGNHYMNGDMLPPPPGNGQRFCVFQNQFNAATTNRTAGGASGLNLAKQQSLRSEDDLDFDPFQETQKGLAELIENDQSLKLHMTANGNGPTSQINGLLHSQGGNSMLPPPPPGFVQPHMNSFGSKILPYLNMNSQQQLNTSQNWPNSYNSVLHQQPQHKGMAAAACNDWKVLDPAIVSSSSRYFSLPPTLRSAEQNGPAMRAPPYDFAAPTQQAAFAQLQPPQQQQQQQPPPPQQQQQPPTPQGYNFAHLNAAAQQNLHWLGTDLNAQISTPPGFRNQGQATKQQEC